jgi:hypothetical protein
MSQHAIVQALRRVPKAPALPQALAAAEAAVVIERASFCAPEFVDVEPALSGQPVPESDAGIPASLETQPAEPAPKTGLHGRPIITLKKSRKVVSK